MSAVTTGSGQTSEIIWEESIYFSFEITDGVWTPTYQSQWTLLVPAQKVKF